MPVAISPIDRQLRAMLRQLAFQGRNQSAILFIDGTLSAQLVVVLGHFQHALARNVFAPQDVLEKRHHIGGLFRSAEGNHQNGVVFHELF